MKTVERECLLCQKHRGRCPVCQGTGSLGSKSRRGGQRLEIDSMGRPVLERTSWEESYSCSLCGGRGHCFRCNGTKVVTEPTVPLAIPGGPVTLMQLELQDQHWQDFLARKPDYGSTFGRMGSFETRQAALKLLALLSDREINILSIFTRGQSRLGWKYDGFRKRLSRQYNREEIDESLGILAEYGLVDLTSCSDAQGLFVGIEPARSDEVRLITQLLSIEDWFE